MKLSNNFLNCFLTHIKFGWKPRCEVLISNFNVLICCAKNTMKKNLKRGALYLDFPDCIKIKKAIINPMNDGKYFIYAPTIALNQKEI